MRSLLIAALAALSAMVAVPAAAQEVYIGQIQSFGTTYCPEDWHATDGALVPIGAEHALFTLIGNKFGGDGRTTFALPKLAVSAQNGGLTSCIRLSGSVFPSPGHGGSNERPVVSGVYLGQMQVFAFNFCPQGWHAADGGTLPIQQYAALFSLLTNRFGGDDVRTFGLPKLTPTAANGPLQGCILVSGGEFPQR